MAFRQEKTLIIEIRIKKIFTFFINRKLRQIVHQKKRFTFVKRLNKFLSVTTRFIRVIRVPSIRL